MSTESITLKSAAAVGIVGLLGPLVGEYALILVGGFAGGVLSLSFQPEKKGWAAAASHVSTGVLAALVFSSTLSTLIEAMSPTSWNATADMFWTPVSALVAMHWKTGINFALQKLRGLVKIEDKK